MADNDNAPEDQQDLEGLKSELASYRQLVEQLDVERGNAEKKAGELDEKYNKLEAGFERLQARNRALKRQNTALQLQLARMENEMERFKREHRAHLRSASASHASQRSLSMSATSTPTRPTTSLFMAASDTPEQFPSLTSSLNTTTNPRTPSTSMNTRSRSTPRAMSRARSISRSGPMPGALARSGSLAVSRSRTMSNIHSSADSRTMSAFNDNDDGEEDDDKEIFSTPTPRTPAGRTMHSIATPPPNSAGRRTQSLGSWLQGDATNPGQASRSQGRDIPAASPGPGTHWVRGFWRKNPTH